jgi:methyl-branched lipid omega-hydroxylase
VPGVTSDRQAAASFAPVNLDEINLSDIAFWQAPLEHRSQAFAILRQQDPYRYFDLPERDIDFGDPNERGYHALVRYADVVEASKHPERFCSGGGATSVFDQPDEFKDFFGSMINLDDPRHKRLRGLVSAGFTPRQLRRVEDSVQRLAEEIVERVAPMGECDFVTEVAAALPLEIICEMMGVPESQYQYVFEQSNIILGAGDTEYVPDQTKIIDAILGAGFGLAQLMTELAEERRANPTDDLTSALVNAEVDGERLTTPELASFFILLLVAGNETTRNAISWGLHLLTENPDQRDLWMQDFEGRAQGAVEEIVRWASPVIYMRRTVTGDGIVLGDREFRAGDKLMLNYWAADRDPAAFEDPDAFRVDRTMSVPHVGFGAPGPHFCLGAHLARREITVVFRELFRRLPDIRATAPPDRLTSSFINGIKHLPCEFTPAG